jgi:hypothetical protein
LLAGGSTGEFRRQVDRLLAQAEETGKRELDKFLTGIPEYLAYRQSCDDFSSSKDPMVFTPKEVYLPTILTVTAINNSFRRLFLSAGRRLLILPPCICQMTEGRCKAKTIKSLLITHCAHCRSDCYAHIITQWAEAGGVKTFLAPSKIERSFKRLKQRYGPLGIVGVACFMDLLVGMLKCMEIGLVPQGVPLVANRCQRWSGEELRSALDVGWLAEVLDLANPPDLAIVEGKREDLRRERAKKSSRKQSQYPKILKK